MPFYLKLVKLQTVIYVSQSLHMVEYHHKIEDNSEKFDFFSSKCGKSHGTMENYI